jgi:glucokinase
VTRPALREVVAAVDLGGTRTKAALVDRELSVVVRLMEPTPPDLALDVGGTVASVVSRLAALSSDVRVVGCGVVVPGVIDEATGVGVVSVNHGWRDLPIRSRVLEAVGVPTIVGHDVRAGLVAEARIGAATGARNALSCRWVPGSRRL